jgi:hypothetical protein
MWPCEVCGRQRSDPPSTEIFRVIFELQSSRDFFVAQTWWLAKVYCSLWKRFCSGSEEEDRGRSSSVIENSTTKFSSECFLLPLPIVSDSDVHPKKNISVTVAILSGRTFVLRPGKVESANALMPSFSSRFIGHHF